MDYPCLAFCVVRGSINFKVMVDLVDLARNVAFRETEKIDPTCGVSHGSLAVEATRFVVVAVWRLPSMLT